MKKYESWSFPPFVLDKNGYMKIDHLSRLDLFRLNYLARKQKRNIKGLICQGILKYIKSIKK